MRNLLSGLLFLITAQVLWGQSLEAQLLSVPTTVLAGQAQQLGDPARGAIVFFQPHMACSKCHTVGGQGNNGLGPDLAGLGKEVSDVALVESVLQPSKQIRQGFESLTVLTADGKTQTGLLVERTGDRLVLREVSTGEKMVYSMSQLEQVRSNKQSIMPDGQINQLASQQQFLDLIRYLMEIRDGGPIRALELQPPPHLIAYSIPEYESHLDHAGLIGSWGDESLKRGEAIYNRVCKNCHGDRNSLGSLPTSLRFAEGKFKNGSDPLAIYHTLTKGFGQMTPQTWMVPQQKYDVIHYIRETYLRPHNPTQYFALDEAYVRQLPKGDTFGPEPSQINVWSAMDYGPTLTHTYQIPGEQLNIAYKGVAARLDPGAGGIARGHDWIVFDTDTLRVAAAWSATNPGESFIDWRSIQFNGQHQIHPQLVGRVHFANPIGPGWASPATGSFADDQRVIGRDARKYGPLPRSWGRFRGLYHHGPHSIFSYSVGSVDVLESPQVLPEKKSLHGPVVVRRFSIGPRDRDLTLQVADSPAPDSPAIPAGLFYGTTPEIQSLIWRIVDGQLRLTIPAGDKPIQFAVWMASDQRPPASTTANSESFRMGHSVLQPAVDSDLNSLIHGGPSRWPQVIAMPVVSGVENGPLAVDTLSAPENNPWLAQTRFTGLDFFSDGRMAVCSWDGDVWIVQSEFVAAEAGQRAKPQERLLWRRIASGMFQPLGLRIVKDKIHVTCRDQLTVLHDLNGDEEIDYYECLNNDHQVTEHFHEFAMGLQTDDAGNFYYAKSGRHALKALVPHHGTLLRVSRDGSRTDILATGFRAANGVCLNPDGTFVVTDQEGFWNPKNRINWVKPDAQNPRFYGNMFGYTDVTDSSDEAMEKPLCWITNEFDRSPGELLWVTSDRWGPLKGSLLNLSYGYGKVYLVPHEAVGEDMQGGMIALPIPAFPTGVMRGRFHPSDQELYLCGMFSWAGSAQHPGGLYRLRTTDKPINLPIKLRALTTGMQLTFTSPLDAESVKVNNVAIRTWALKRTANYGSKHYDDRELQVTDVNVSENGTSVQIYLPEIQPTWCMEIKYQFKARNGQAVEGTIHNTIHRLHQP